MMSSKNITAFLPFVTIFLYITIKVSSFEPFNPTPYLPWHIDNIVRYCENKEREFAATEDKYAEKGPEDPDIPNLFPIPFIVEQQIKANELELSQRNFECIADMLKIYSDQSLQLSSRYRKLVKKCRSIQPTTPHCDPYYRYRLINGTCNNLFQPKRGSTFGPFRRLWGANYEGVSGLRKSVQRKKPLPDPRDISRELIKPVTNEATYYNTIFALFGQVIAHDLAMFPTTMVNGSMRLDCCSDLNKKDRHPQCEPIYLKQSDTFYSSKDVSCFNFARIIPYDSCSVEKRIPMNYLTAHLDLSLVYGQTDDRALYLRRNDGSGMLRVQHGSTGDLLPPEQRAPSPCDGIGKQVYYFQTGDTRSNQHSALTIFQTLLLREHNRVAEKLKVLNPQWGEETLYQEARRIVIAEFQVITYKEYLPILLGPKLMYEYGLNIGYGSNYDPSIDPSISVEFNAASFRVHSPIPGRIVFDEDVQYLKYLYGNTCPLYSDKMTSYLKQMANNPAGKYGTFMPNDTTLFLYRTPHGIWGFDLTAVDIQRGRDIGLPTYAQVIEHMENRPGTIRTFSDLRCYITPECQMILPKIYLDVRDVDFYAGILCERIADGMVISSTPAKIIAEQFAKSKFGDRFYFEHDPTLTYEQRKTLMNSSLSKFICDNTDVEILQSVAFLLPSYISNRPRLCSEMPDVDLEKWQE